MADPAGGFRRKGRGVHNMEHSMNRATATAFALVMAMSASGAGAQSVLWGGPTVSPSPAPSSPSSNPPPIWNAPGASGAAAQGFPTTTAPAVVQGYPVAPQPSVGGTFQGYPSAPPAAPGQNFGSGSGSGWPGGYGRWNRDRDRDSEPTYNAWRGDDSQRARELVQRLERLISAAERQRAADPEFLSDLRELLARYEDRDSRPGSAPSRPGSQGPGLGGGPQQPPRPPAPPRVYMSDDFADGDFTRGTVWTPRQGQWSVDPVNGLRSLRPPAPQPASRQISPQELLQALLVGPQSLGLGQQQQAQQPSAALIEYAQTVPNAFTLKTRLTDHRGDGAAYLIAHQGGANWNGYRLELRGGYDGRAVLSRRGASGYTDLANAPLRRFAPNLPHDVEWTRSANGAMSVRVDGESLFSVTDTGFRDDWRGFAFFNAGGDYSLRSISIEENR